MIRTKNRLYFPEQLDNFRLGKLLKRRLGGTAITDYEYYHYTKKLTVPPSLPVILSEIHL